jgi:hypothetical protein
MSQNVTVSANLSPAQSIAVAAKGQPMSQIVTVSANLSPARSIAVAAKGQPMSQNVTVSANLSPAQSIAVATLVSGSTITGAAEKAGVSRETVSRWVHRDPLFIAELQNTRAEIAAQTRCALESLGKRSVEVLRDAIQKPVIYPNKLKAACAVLKLLGADRAETVAPTTAEEVSLQLRLREDEVRRYQAQLSARDFMTGASSDPQVVSAMTGSDGRMALGTGNQR